MTTTFARSCSLAFAVAVLPRLAVAEDGRSAASISGQAHHARRDGDSDAARLDGDFFLQGEYAGTLRLADGSPAWTGLQVVALGDGNFQAVEYAGGLPGNGWDKKTRRKSAGRKTAEGIAELSGEGRRLSVRRGMVLVRNETGNELGRLKKYQRMSRTLHARRPPGARVLFFGRDARQFAGGVVTPDHLLVAGADTRDSFGSFSMHLEFRTPYMPAAREQARGNSGVYIQGRYEVQILDSFGLAGADNECGALYKQSAPLVNMCFPPLAWQTYDIDFTAARFDAQGRKTHSARITVRHNGVVIHEQAEITGKTGAGAPEGPDARPIRLQDHGNAVYFRNIWIVER